MLLCDFWFCDHKHLGRVSSICTFYPGAKNSGSSQRQSSISIDRKAEGQRATCLIFSTSYCFQNIENSLSMECLFKAVHSKPNMFYDNSSWPWSSDVVERYIVSKLSLVIVIALTFGNDLHIFKVISITLPLPLTFFF